MSLSSKFKLPENFVEKYRHKKPDFGFNGLGEIVFMRTYSRIKDNGLNEEWFETVERVVNGCYTMQKEWIESNGLGWNTWKAVASAQEMYDRIFQFKFTPPGRGLWAMGTPIIEEKRLYTALNNCAFVSTKNLKEDLSKPFCFLMDVSMLGCGCGFDVLGAGTVVIKNPNKERQTECYVIPDTREGWVESLKLLLESYFLGAAPIEFDYSNIRAAGLPIKSFGGTSSGPAPLQELHKAVRRTLDKGAGEPISATCITDLQNLIGKCVVAGNVRRTAEIAFGNADDLEYLDLKNYRKNPGRKEFGWTSNNSVFAEIGMDYGAIVERILDNGEPGLIWLDNMRKYSRMEDPADNIDHRVTGTNPCTEQSLESYEMCNLTETFPARHDNLADYLRTLKFAYLYSKTVTLGKSHWSESSRVMLRNRRIGCSMSGIAQFIAARGLADLRKWMEEGYKTIRHYDTIYSDWLAIPKSIKVTSIKPSGTVSLLAGATPGLHFPRSRYYIRRVRISKLSALVPALVKAGYPVEPCADDKENSVVVEVPVDAGPGVRVQKDLSMWEQLELAAFCQRYWADNQISATVTFSPETEGQSLKHALEFFQFRLKGISFLPQKKEAPYAQMPYQEIHQKIYSRMAAGLKKIHFKDVRNEQADVERFCDGQSCALAGAKTQVL